MENIIRTAQGALLQSIQLLGLPFSAKAHTTLNEKFNIHADVSAASTDMPRMRYAAIGNGGHRMVVGANGISRPEPVQHRPRDCALYNHLPFVLREPTNDLTAAERSLYRLRRTETHDGKTYVAYYLKLLDFTNTIPQMDYKTIVDGATYSTAFEPTIGDLSPTPPELTNSGTMVTTGDYLSATAKVVFNMSAADITEFLNVCNIIYGDENYAMITEIAFCSGVDRAVVGDFNGVSVGYTDTIATQVVSFMNTFYSLLFSNSGLNISIDVGSTESMLALTSP